MGIFEKFKSGFKKSASAFTTGLRDIVVKKEIDDKTLDKIEDYLIQSDVGIVSASEIREIISQTKIDPNKDLTDEINNILKNYIISIMKPLENIEFFKKKEKLNATLISGVNGVGKTTTIGKLAYQFKSQGKKIILGAADTFRAGAIDQLQIWSDRAGVQLIRQEMGSDPASVAFDTLQAATKQGADIVFIDTAGRLHNKINLMNELSKVKRVMAKVIPDAPHEVMLVLDGSTGQNAFEQAKQFTAATEVTSLAITKLDGTAKGGVLLGISDQFQIPVKYIGVGEGIEDLQLFDKRNFIQTLFS